MRPSLIASLGLSPLPQRLKEARLALFGDGSTPKTQFDLSSLKQLQPTQAVQLWLGRKPKGRRTEIINFFNRTQTPIEHGWSVRVTQVRDFRGKGATYDSHNGTDFAVPPGMRVCAPAPAVVLRVSSEFNRGGLKVFLDHGQGLVTTSNHLAHSFVKPGDVIARGEVFALSGYSGLDGVVGFPWMAPHIHFNVWLNGASVDPFAAANETPLWRTGNFPTPHDGVQVSETFEPTAWSQARVQQIIDACTYEAAREEIQSQPTLAERAMAALYHLNYYPTRFSSRPELYDVEHGRAPRLDLPLHREDYDGVVYRGETS